MSGKSNNHGEKPWNAQFDSERNAKGEVSRSATRKKEKGNAAFVTFLTIALLVLAALPVGAWSIVQSQMNKPVTSQQATTSKKKTKKVATATKHKAKATSSSKKATKKASSTKASSSSSVASSVSSSSVAASSSSAASSQSSASSSSASSSSSSAGKTYVTVGAGQGLYRVAVNNGLTVSELLQMNGLSSASKLSPGQQLRVK
jgi:LysM repeat protein